MSSPVCCWPSAARVASSLRLSRVTWTTESRLITTGRIESVCGQIGVSVSTSASGLTMAPPAASEYAVEPVGELAMSPSQR